MNRILIRNGRLLDPAGNLDTHADIEQATFCTREWLVRRFTP